MFEDLVMVTVDLLVFLRLWSSVPNPLWFATAPGARSRATRWAPRCPFCPCRPPWKASPAKRRASTPWASPWPSTSGGCGRWLDVLAWKNLRLKQWSKKQKHEKTGWRCEDHRFCFYNPKKSATTDVNLLATRQSWSTAGWRCWPRWVGSPRIWVSECLEMPSRSPPSRRTMPWWSSDPCHSSLDGFRNQKLWCLSWSCWDTSETETLQWQSLLSCCWPGLRILVWLGYLELFGFLAIINMQEGKTDRKPGDFGLRGFYPQDSKGQYDMQAGGCWLHPNWGHHRDVFLVPIRNWFLVWSICRCVWWSFCGRWRNCVTAAWPCWLSQVRLVVLTVGSGKRHVIHRHFFLPNTNTFISKPRKATFCPNFFFWSHLKQKKRPTFCSRHCDRGSADSGEVALLRCSGQRCPCGPKGGDKTTQSRPATNTCLRPKIMAWLLWCTFFKCSWNRTCFPIAVLAVIP